MLSNKYLNWSTCLDLTTCKQCRSLHGKIYLVDENIHPIPPLHPNCHCLIIPLKAIYVGQATTKGKDGADWWLMLFGELPDYYVSYNEAKACGWNPHKGNLKEILPGKMISKGIYLNSNNHLPSLPGRIWFEADINYISGYRNTERILYSNDGLIFVTYDHYKTFYEIIGELIL